MQETTWQQDAAKVLNALAEHEAQASGSVQRLVGELAEALKREGDATWKKYDTMPEGMEREFEHGKFRGIEVAQRMLHAYLEKLSNSV